MLKRVSLLTLAVVLSAAPSWSQAVASKTRAHVETLASERFGGREAGSDGERLAGAYIAAQLARVGAKPLPGRSDMFQPFEFTAGSRDGGTTVTVTQRVGPAQKATAFRTGVQALSFSDDARVSGEIVFAGYG